MNLLKWLQVSKHIGKLVADEGPAAAAIEQAAETLFADAVAGNGSAVLADVQAVLTLLQGDLADPVLIADVKALAADFGFVIP